MYRPGVPSDPSRGRRSRLVRALAVLALVAVAATAGGLPSRAPSSPDLRLASTTDPAPPTNVTATGSDRALAISWTASTEAFISHYEVALDGTLVASPTTTSVTVGGLVNGRDYVVTVRTVTSVLDTTYRGTTTSAPVTGRPRDAVAPAPPTAVTATRGDGRVTVSWTANSTDGDADGYRVLRGDIDVTGLLPGAATTSWTDTSVVNDTTYSYTVQTHDTSGNWSPSSTPAATATPTDLTAPATPTGVVGGRGDGRAGLSWTANAEPDVVSYSVLRDGVEVASVTTTSYLDLGLTNDTSYSYTVVAVDGHGNRSPASAVVVVTPTDLTPPEAPTGLVAVRGDAQVTLTWDANAESDLADYRLLRDGVEIATVAGALSYLDVAVTNDITYSYRLVAVDTHGNRSVSSDPVSATPTDLGAPAAPTGLVVTRGDGEVTLSWTANAEPDVADYRLLRDGVEIATVTGTAYTDPGLVNDTTYSYRLVAVDGHGNRSAPSDAVAGTPTDLTPPVAPTGLAATRGDGEVALSWTGNADADLADYRVLRDGVEIATVTGTAYTDSGLVNDRTYDYRVVAVDGHGNRSAPSDAVPGTPTDLTAPAAPTGLTTTRGDGTVSLKWTANAEPDVASYRVLRDEVEIATVTGTTYTDRGLVNGTSYTYRLVAVDGHGNRSPSSAPVSATPTGAGAPAAPTGLAAARGDGEVALTWTANADSDLASYRVLRDGVEVATVTGTGYTDTGLTNDVTYTYTLTAVDTDGNRSAESAPATATPTDLTPPAPPGGLVATSGDQQVQLSWTANTEPDLVDYRVLRDGVEIVTVAGTTYTDTGLVNETTYTYSLVAVDGHDNRSGQSAGVAATPHDVPDAPTGVTAEPGDHRAVLGWTEPADPDVVEYRVVNEDGTTAVTVTAPASGATVTGLTNGTIYRYTVVAVNAAGKVSPRSESVSVVPASPSVPTTGSGETGGVAASSDGRFVVVGTRERREAADTNTAYELYLIDRSAGTARRIAPLPAAATGASDPTNTAAPAVSDDGRYIALATTAALVATDTNGLSDVYRIDVTTGTRTLASVPAGGGVNGSTAGAVVQSGPSVYATSPPVVMSADGDLVLFYSARADLVPGDTNNAVDLFAKRLSTGAVTRVSTTVTGGNLPGPAIGPALAITPDGRFALFPSNTATGVTLLYRKTLSGAGTGDLTVVSSVTVNGRATQFGVYRDSGDIAISDDGRYVALVTTAKITTSPGTTGSTGLAYRVDTSNGTALALGNGQQTVWEHKVELDPTGRYAFFSTAAAALPIDGNGHTDHYRRDLGGGVVGPLLLVTSDADGKATGGPTGPVAPAEYGRLLAISGDLVQVATSQALVSADTNRIRDLYLKDLVTGRVSSPVG